MKKLSFLFCLLFLTPILMAQNGKVYDDLSMKSKLLTMDRKYSIYLPSDYETSKRSYPVLYILHGSGGTNNSFIQFGELQYIEDKAIREGIVTPMIIVMPDANRDSVRRGYSNDIKGDWPYENFFFNEFMLYIEKTYRIKAEKDYRAITGASMG